MERDKDVKGKTDEFQRDENQEDIFRADHEQHANGGQQEQREIFSHVLGEGGIDGQPGGKDR